MLHFLDLNWKIEDYNDCWYDCDFKGGSCSWCGPVGHCCSGNPDNSHLNGDCGTAQLLPLVEYWQISGNGYHMCVIPTNKIG